MTGWDELHLDWVSSVRRVHGLLRWEPWTEDDVEDVGCLVVDWTVGCDGSR